MGVGFSVIVALIKQNNTNIGYSLRRLTWIAFGYFCLFCFVGYVEYTVLVFKVTIKEPGNMINHWQVIKALFNLSPFDNPLIMAIYIFYICCSFGLGISGFFLLRAPRWVHGVSTVSQNPFDGAERPDRQD
jgi:hypothetical protein